MPHVKVLVCLYFAIRSVLFGSWGQLRGGEGGALGNRIRENVRLVITGVGNQNAMGEERVVVVMEE